MSLSQLWRQWSSRSQLNRWCLALVFAVVAISGTANIASYFWRSCHPGTHIPKVVHVRSVWPADVDSVPSQSLCDPKNPLVLVRGSVDHLGERFLVHCCSAYWRIAIGNAVARAGPMAAFR